MQDEPNTTPSPDLQKLQQEFREKYPALAEMSARLAEERNKVPKRKSGMSAYGGTYYKKHFANELLFVLDRMLEDDKDRIYTYSKFPGFSKSTLEMKIRQSWHFIMDNMDPDGRYATLWQRTKIAEDANKTGIRLKRLKETLVEADVVMPDIVEDDSTSFEWRKELDEWLINAPVNSVFKRDNLNLMEETVENLCAALSQLSNVEFKVTTRKILVMKIE